MDTEEPEQHPTIAGRALRALRTTRAPVEPAPAAPVGPAPDAPTEAPEADEAAAPVNLAKAPKPTVERAPEPSGAPRQPTNALLIAAIIVLAATVVFAAISLVVYLNRSDTPTAAKAAQARDNALVAARIDIATLNTLDYRDVQPGLQKWLAVSTGAFHAQLAQQTKSVASAIAKAKISTTGRVIAAAVTDLNAARTSAIVIASLDTVKTPAGGTSAVDRNRYRATMQLVDGVWKIADLSIVAVGLS